MGNKAYASGFKVPTTKPARTSVTEKAVAAFVDREDIEAKGSKKRRAELGARLNIILPSTTARRLRQAAVLEERSISDAVSEAVEMWLKSRKTPALE